jgi:peptide/nickel transport system substrate-binding protein
MRAPFTRREFLAVTGRASGTLALAALVASCSSKTSSGQKKPGRVGTVSGAVPGPGPVTGGTYGGTVRVGWENEPNSLDPALGYNLSAWDAITQVLYFGGLLGFGGQSGSPVANIAQRMPQVSSDGRTLTFVIRPDVKFHNGRAITAEDFKWSWERMLQPSLASWATSYLSSVVGYQDVVKGRTKTLEGVEAPDDRTLRLTLAQPDFTILNALSLPMTAPVPREEVERLGKDFGRKAVGFGPFKLDSYDEAGQKAVFTKFDDYFWKGLPYPDAVEYRWGVDPELQVLQLQHGDLDILGDGMPSGDVGRFASSPQLKSYLRRFPSPGNWSIQLYVNHPPFDNQQVRQALNWAVNRAEFERVLYGQYTPSGYPFPDLAGYHHTAQPYGFDLGKARQLLSEGGYPDGFEATLTFDSSPSSVAQAQVLQQQLAAVGVKLKLDQVSSNALYDLEAKGSIQMAVGGWYMIQPTPADEVNALYVSGASDNFNYYSNAQVDALAKQALSVFDEGQRNQLYSQIEQLISADAPSIWLGTTDWVAGVNPAIENYHYRGELYGYYDRLWFSS